MQNTTGRAYEYTVYHAVRAELRSRGYSVKHTRNRNFSNIYAEFSTLRKLNPDKISAFKKSATKISKMIVDAIESDLDVRAPVLMVVLNDDVGKIGDIRDFVIFQEGNVDKGISIKVDNDEVKHSRISDQEDSMLKWLGFESSSEYLCIVNNLFGKLRQLVNQKKKIPWSAIQRDADYLTPLRDALGQELERQYEANPAEVSWNLTNYFVGSGGHNYVKVQHLHKGSFTYTNFNLHDEFNVPKIVNSSNSFAVVPFGSKSLMLRIGDWTFRIRLHSGSSKVEASVKISVVVEHAPEGLVKITHTW